jgi:hypothetical protein
VFQVDVWKIGASLSALTSCIALIAQAQLNSANQVAPPFAHDKWSYEYFDAWWYEPSPDCSIYDSCVFLVIEERVECSADVLVSFTVSDDKDLFLGSQTHVITASTFKSGEVVEVGTDSANVAYFAIDEITCSTGWDTTERSV